MTTATTVRTVGHGTLDADSFVALLLAADVDELVDVRTYPGSRRHPQYGRDAMAAWLPAAGVGYSWEPALGGRRRPQPSSPHVALRNEGFRAYADHMGTSEFVEGVDRLVGRGAERAVAVMCAESVWWRCHRRLLADALVLLRDVPVEHLFHDGRLAAHAPTEGVRVDDGRLVYDLGAPVPLPGGGEGGKGL